MIVSLQRQLAYALENQASAFWLGSCDRCLAASATGNPMYDEEDFRNGDKVHPRFARFTLAILDYGDQAAYERYPKDPRLRGDYRHKLQTMTGKELSVAVQRLIDEEDPVSVARHCVEQRSDHSETEGRSSLGFPEAALT